MAITLSNNGFQTSSLYHSIGKSKKCQMIQNHQTYERYSQKYAKIPKNWERVGLFTNSGHCLRFVRGLRTEYEESFAWVFLIGPPVVKKEVREKDRYFPQLAMRWGKCCLWGENVGKLDGEMDWGKQQKEAAMAYASKMRDEEKKPRLKMMWKLLTANAQMCALANKRLIRFLPGI